MSARSRPAGALRGPRRRGATSASLLIGVLLSATGCGNEASSIADAASPAASTRPATKDTCPDVVWEPAPSLGVVPTSRELVGFSPTLLGVHTSWAGHGFTAETVAGGYADDLTEPYDDLRVTGHRTLEGGVQAEVSRGEFLDDPVLIVIWRDANQDAPCDLHALLVRAVDAATEEQALAGLR